MNLDLLLDNLTNPALLFFVLGIIAVQLKSDLAIPENSSKFSLAEFKQLAAGAGFRVKKVWTDDRKWFSVQYLENIRA